MPQELTRMKNDSERVTNQMYVTKKDVYGLLEQIKSVQTREYTKGNSEVLAALGRATVHYDQALESMDGSIKSRVVYAPYLKAAFSNIKSAYNLFLNKRN